jgi:levanbiose-producing levanase
MWRNRYHLTVPDGWMNDPQRPIWLDGAYHLYYLYNDEYPRRRTKSWRHVSTVDGLRFVDHGVAVARDSEPNGLLMSGSAVVDVADSAGFGRGAVVALITQPDAVYGAGAQAQFLWYSLDGGFSFRSLGGRPVIANPGKPDFRDPKLLWDSQRRQWLCVLAEGTDLGFYTSKDLRTWTSAGRVHEDRFGILECPDVFRMKADDGTHHWVLATSAKRLGGGQPETYCYWTGDFDRHEFRRDDHDPNWLDYGHDWYAAVTWPTEGTDSPDTRWAIAWMNNWAYAHDAPTLEADGFNGSASIVRKLHLCHSDGGYRLRSRPVLAIGSGEYAYELIDHAFSDALPQPIHSRCFYAEVSIPAQPGRLAGLRVRGSQDGSRYVEVGVAEGVAYVDRSRGGDPSGGRFSRSEVEVGRGRVTLQVLVDHTSVEVFVDGDQAMTNLAFSPPEDDGISTFDRSARPTTGSVRIALVD